MFRCPTISTLSTSLRKACNSPISIISLVYCKLGSVFRRPLLLSRLTVAVVELVKKIPIPGMDLDAVKPSSYTIPSGSDEVFLGLLNLLHCHGVWHLERSRIYASPCKHRIDRDSRRSFWLLSGQERVRIPPLVPDLGEKVRAFAFDRLDNLLPPFLLFICEGSGDAMQSRSANRDGSVDGVSLSYRRWSELAHVASLIRRAPGVALSLKGTFSTQVKGNNQIAYV